MIVQVTLEDITASVDSDGDQGDGYSSDVMADMLQRASHEALRLWLATRQAILEDSLEDDGEQ